MKKIFLVAGARPNFMKIAPLWPALTESGRLKVELVHTGQHYDHAMSQVFFDQLGLPAPRFRLEAGSAGHGAQTAMVLSRIEELLLAERPDMVVVAGDVNSTLAAALAAAKLNIPVAHVEAGLRSFDRTMPEEINRLLTDQISALLFVSEPSGVTNLTRENVSPGKIHLVGNLMIDSLAKHLPRIKAAGTREQYHLVAGAYGVITIHRPANVDTPEKLRLVEQVVKLAVARGEAVWPIHPRTRKNLESAGMMAEIAHLDGLRLTPPLGYFDFLNLVAEAAFVLTDSGGIQEETTWLGIPCLTMRDNTERPITVQEGTNRLVGLDPETVAAALAELPAQRPPGYEPPALWDGRAAERTRDIIEKYLSTPPTGSASISFPG